MRKKQHVLSLRIGGLNLKKFPNRGFEWTYQDRQRGREKLKPYLNRHNLTMKAPDGID